VAQACLRNAEVVELGPARVWTSVLVRWVEDPGVDLLASLEQAMAHLEAGLPR
jgi:hypothetical protein